MLPLFLNLVLLAIMFLSLIIHNFFKNNRKLKSMKNTEEIRIEGMNVSIKDKAIIKGLSLKFPISEITIIMGPNGSGKSSFLYGLFHHPEYTSNYNALLNDKRINISDYATLIPQQPVELEGISVRQLAWALAKDKMNASEVSELLNKTIDELNLKKEVINRKLVGFSGGERKRIELLLAIMSKPKFIFIDEIDSGLDVDTIKVVANKINQLKKEGIGCGIITHYPTMLNLLDASKIYVIKEGKIVHESNNVKEVSTQISEKGYDKFLENA